MRLPAWAPGGGAKPGGEDKTGMTPGRGHSLTHGTSTAAVRCLSLVDMWTGFQAGAARQDTLLGPSATDPA